LRFKVCYSVRQLVLIAARVLVVVILLFAPWAFGTTERWSLAVVEISVAVAVLLTVIVGLTSRSLNADLWHWYWGGPLVALGGYMALQALNPATHYESLTGTVTPQRYIAWLPHTMDTVTTWATLLKYFCYGGLFWTVRVCFPESRHVRILLTILLVSSFLVALLAILHKLSGAHDMLWIRSLPPGMGSFGPFINRNNYAAFMNLIIPLCPALAWVWEREAERKGQKSHPGYIAYVMAAVMIASVFFSESRAGMLICVGLIGGWLIFEFTFKRSLRRLGVGLLFCLLGVAAALAYVGWGPIQKRLETLRDLPRVVQERQAIPSLALKVFRDHPVFGTGAGTFAQAFPDYQPASVEGFYQYAHNDWVQYLLELGIVGSALLLAFGVGALWPCWESVRGLKREKPETSSQKSGLHHTYFTMAVVLALMGVGLHAVVDFPLHIPGIAITVVALFAILTVPVASLAS
jgi:O-antigen ligase